MAQAGFLAPDGKSKLIEKRGIEVGNIFQLGYHYSKKMKNATFIDRDGKAKPYYMGCYGIGLGRTMAAIVEIHHDDKGIIWPKSVAPFQVHLVSLAGGEEQAEKIYHQLKKANIEVLYDDRAESAGVKLADADLIGCPIRLVISKRNGDQVEIKGRTETEGRLVSLDKVMLSF
jgi:prolyl-tRNA synthetase